MINKCITEAECFNALKALKHLLRNFETLKHALNQLSCNKHPGLDRFSIIEFYKTFWNNLKILFLDCGNYFLQNNLLCSSQYEDFITLIPIFCTDNLCTFNYCPITLLNCN